MRAVQTLPVVAAMVVGGLAIAVAPSYAATNATELVSRASGTGGAKGNGPADVAGPHSVSADGRFVVFGSTATNLDASDTTAAQDIYVRDLQTSATILVSRATGAAGIHSDGISSEPAISGDGHLVVFRSTAANLDPAAPNGGIFVRDLTAQTTTVVGRATGPTGAVDVGADTPDISTDGSTVAWETTQSLVDPADPDPSLDIFVRNLATGTTTLASRANGATGPRATASPWCPRSLPREQGRVHDDGHELRPDRQRAQPGRLRPRPRRPHDHARQPADGHRRQPGRQRNGEPAAQARTARRSPSGPATPRPARHQQQRDVYVRRLDRCTTVLASAGPAGTTIPFLNVENASISADGTRVVFGAGGDGLDPADNNGQGDIMVRDLVDGTISVVSRPTGTSGQSNDFSEHPSISGDGATVAFRSLATNLSADDTATSDFDVYIRAWPRWAHGSCPWWPATARGATRRRSSALPDTQLQRITVNRHARRLTVRFTATGQVTGFECAVGPQKATPRYVPCASPFRAKHLHPRKYRLYVRAVGPGGTDPTPAGKKFKIPAAASGLTLTVGTSATMPAQAAAQRTLVKVPMMNRSVAAPCPVPSPRRSGKRPTPLSASTTATPSGKPAARPAKTASRSRPPIQAPPRRTSPAWARVCWSALGARSERSTKAKTRVVTGPPPIAASSR